MIKKTECMNQTDEKLKTFCPLLWRHISANTMGIGVVCCCSFEMLKNDDDKMAFWKDSNSLFSYFNSKSHKKIRLKMLKGERPSHCAYCFSQEDHGVKSLRLQFIDQYQSDLKEMIASTNADGSIDNPKIDYVDMSLGNKCNLKCRMCHPYSSYIIGKDWQKMGKVYDEGIAKRILKDKWYASTSTLKMLKEALPDVKVILSTGGEPMLVKEHLRLLEMIIEEGHAHHIQLRYSSNYVTIPKEILELWKPFQEVHFYCSIEAYGKLNNYIRYPSKWENLEKSMYFLDNLFHEYDNIKICIHTTFQAYNVIKIPELLNYLRYADFKSLHRFPSFIWIKVPKWCSPALFPKKMRYRMADKILETLKRHEDFFLSYNKVHQNWSRNKMQILKGFCQMMKNDNTQERHICRFIEETKKHDRLRKQSVLDVLPELEAYFR